MAEYQITTPVSFDPNSNPSAWIDFQSAGAQNQVRNFVGTAAGDVFYNTGGPNNVLARLPIGANGQSLVVTAGLPAWGNPSSSGQSTFRAVITGSTGAIPTSRDAAPDQAVWFPLAGVTPYVTWTASYDPDFVFITAAGVNYGCFVTPTTGVYEFNALITFEAGNDSSGQGLTIGAPPYGFACRQARIYNTTTGTALAVLSRQVEASAQNGTAIVLSTGPVSLNAGAIVQVQVRHDRTTNKTLTIGTPALSAPGQNIFSGTRVA